MSITRRDFGKAVAVGGLLVLADACGTSKGVSLPTTPPDSAGSSNSSGATGSSGSTAAPVPLGMPQKPAWKLTFSDEFDGNQLNTAKWSQEYAWGPGDGSTQAYLPANSRLDGDGHLVLTARRETVTVAPVAAAARQQTYEYTSGMVTTFDTYKFTYGAIEMRAQLPRGTGVRPTFWILPDGDGWPVQVATVATPKALATADTSDAFHVYGMQIEKDMITWYVDGKEVGQVTGPARASLLATGAPWYVVANLMVVPSEVDGAAWPQELVIDYIRAWQ